MSIEGGPSLAGSVALPAPSIEAGGPPLSPAPFSHTPSISVDTLSPLNLTGFSRSVSGFETMFLPDVGGSCNVGANLLTLPELKLESPEASPKVVSPLAPSKAERFLADFETIGRVEVVELDKLVKELPGFTRESRLPHQLEFGDSLVSVGVEPAANFAKSFEEAILGPATATQESSKLFLLPEGNEEPKLTDSVVEALVEETTELLKERLSPTELVNTELDVSSEIDEDRGESTLVVDVPQSLVSNEEEVVPTETESLSQIPNISPNLRQLDAGIQVMGDQLIQAAEVLKAYGQTDVEPKVATQTVVEALEETGIKTMVIAQTEPEPREATEIQARISELTEKVTDLERQIERELEESFKEKGSSQLKLWFFLDREALGYRYEAAKKVLETLFAEDREEVTGREVIGLMPLENRQIRSEVLDGTSKSDNSYFESNFDFSTISRINSVADGLNRYARISRDKPPIRIAVTGEDVSEYDVFRVLEDKVNSKEVAVYSKLLNDYLQVQLEISYLTQRVSGVTIRNGSQVENRLEKVTASNTTHN